MLLLHCHFINTTICCVLILTWIVIISKGAKKKSTSRLPILALGRSESMALYTDSTMTEEEYLEQQMQEQQQSAQAEAMALLSQGEHKSQVLFLITFRTWQCNVLSCRLYSC